MTRKPPNILILMADQMAPHFTGTYGHNLVKTPNMDRLAESGCVFNAAYTPSPLCAPARFSFMSGQLPFKIEAYDNAAEFSSSVPTFCHYLRQLGYHSCLSGKMHFVGPDQLHGFSQRLTTDIYPADYSFTPNWLKPDERIDVWYHNMSSVHEAGSAEITYQLEYDDEVGFHAIRKLYDYAREPEQRPFVMVASFTHPHDPYVTRKKYWDLYEHDKIDLPSLSPTDVDTDPYSMRIIRGIQADVNPADEQSMRNARHAYYANVSYIDDHIGQFIDALKGTGLIENTVVLVTADHGDMLGERGLWYKMHFFEQSARIPLIAAGPGIIRSEIDSACSLVDLVPTLIDIANEGRGVSPDSQDSIDGSSLFPLMTESGAKGKDYAMSQYAAECAIEPMIMIREGNLKFIFSESEAPMLFKLDDDPQELNNLAGNDAYRETVVSFIQQITNRWNLNEIRERVIASQQSRLMIQEIMSKSRTNSWDFQPFRNAADDYIRSHKELDDMGEKRRYPRFAS